MRKIEQRKKHIDQISKAKEKDRFLSCRSNTRFIHLVFIWICLCVEAICAFGCEKYKMKKKERKRGAKKTNFGYSKCDNTAKMMKKKNKANGFQHRTQSDWTKRIFILEIHAEASESWRRVCGLFLFFYLKKFSFQLAKAMIFEEALWRLFLQIQRKREEKSVEAEQINKKEKKIPKASRKFDRFFFLRNWENEKKVFRLAHVHREFLEIDRPKNDRRRKSIRKISDFGGCFFFSSKSMRKKVKNGWDDHRNQTKISNQKKLSRRTSWITSWSLIAFKTHFLLVSWISPPKINSSKIKYAFSKLKIMSNSQT